MMSLLKPLCLLLCLPAVQCQEGLSLRGNKIKDHISIQLLPEDYGIDGSIAVGFKPFETTEELLQAVQAYKGYNKIDTTLAATYGWPMNNWQVGAIEDFTNLFLRKTQFDEPLDQWDMSSATSLSGMFMSCLHFQQDLSTWDVSRVKDFSRMFDAATVFDSDIRTWNTTRAVDMSYMFMHAQAFSHNIIADWDVGRVEHMEKIFEDARSMMDYSEEAEQAWPLLRLQQGLPSIDLTNKERREATACINKSLRSTSNKKLRN